MLAAVVTADGVVRIQAPEFESEAQWYAWLDGMTPQEKAAWEAQVERDRKEWARITDQLKKLRSDLERTGKRLIELGTELQQKPEEANAFQFRQVQKALAEAEPLAQELRETLVVYWQQMAARR